MKSRVGQRSSVCPSDEAVRCALTLPLLVIRGSGRLECLDGEPGGQGDRRGGEGRVEDLGAGGGEVGRTAEVWLEERTDVEGGCRREGEAEVGWLKTAGMRLISRASRGG